MRKIGKEYIKYHLENTFREQSKERRLLKIDWYDEKGIRAAAYMSKVNPNHEDVDNFLQNKSLTDLILLFPPLEVE
jgi:hypothetical protein